MATEQKLVSILVRTCNRPNILRGALESIRKQVYSNIEVVIVEDGENTAQEMIEAEFSDLNICYTCVGVHKGRTFVGNLALSMANGEYLNFLDDDDELFPQHVEKLVEVLEKSREKAAYAVAYESIVIYNEKQKCYNERNRKIRYRQPFNRAYLTFNNYIPIQSIMFARELYEELKGFDEQLDFLEDWDLWVRYSTATDFIYLDEVTSLYRVPYRKNERKENMYHAYNEVIKKFEQYNVQVNYYQMNRELEYVLEIIKTPKWKRVLKNIRDKMLYR